LGTTFEQVSPGRQLNDKNEFFISPLPVSGKNLRLLQDLHIYRKVVISSECSSKEKTLRHSGE
jgi:hypothetical protein